VTKVWEYKQIPTIYSPVNVRQTVDFTEFYIKPPQEMSRYELQELEMEIKKAEEAEQQGL